MPPPSCTCEPAALAHAPNQREVHGLAALRAVEIDDVQPARAELAVLHGELDGIDGVARLLREVALAAAARSGRLAGRWPVSSSMRISSVTANLQEIASISRADARRAFGVKLRAEEVALLDDGARTARRTSSRHAYTGRGGAA